MPFGDRTGPRGMGPMTGRGAGYCTGFRWPGVANLIPGSARGGFGPGFRTWYGGRRGSWGRGRGRGLGWRQFTPYQNPWW